MASLCEEEARLMGDSKYRSYVATTEKVLKGFENTSEWADLISTLAKLNKVSGIMPLLMNKYQKYCQRCIKPNK